jgi:hypothetical protein
MEHEHRVESQSEGNMEQRDDALDVRFLVQSLWRGKWITLLLLIGAGLLGLDSMYNYQPTYQAAMTVAPLEGSSGGTASKVSGLARSIGLEVGSSSSGPTMLDRLERVIGSVAFAQHLQNEYGLLQRVFQGSWNEDTQAWVKPKGRRFEFEQRLRSQLNLPVWRVPTIETLAQYLSSSVQFIELDDGFYRVSVAHSMGEEALEILTIAYSEADSLLRDQDKRYTAQRKSYLERQMQRTQVAESRLMLASLLSAEEQRSMLLDSDLPYAARITEPPHLSSRPSTASIRQELAVRLIGAFALGIALSLIWAAARRAR